MGGNDEVQHCRPCSSVKPSGLSLLCRCRYILRGQLAVILQKRGSTACCHAALRTAIIAYLCTTSPFLLRHLRLHSWTTDAAAKATTATCSKQWKAFRDQRILSAAYYYYYMCGNPQPEAIGHTQICLQPDPGPVLCTVCSLVNWEMAYVEYVECALWCHQE